MPTSKEAGIPDFDMTIWHAMYGPKGLSADVLAKLNGALVKALEDKDLVAKFEAVGTQTFPRADWTPDAHMKRLTATIDGYLELFKSAGIAAQEAK